LVWLPRLPGKRSRHEHKSDHPTGGQGRQAEAATLRGSRRRSPRPLSRRPAQRRREFGAPPSLQRHAPHGSPRPRERPTTRAEARHLGEQGLDAAAQRRDDHTVVVEIAERHETDSVEALSALFVERHAKKRRTWATTKETFHRLILPKWRGRTVHDVRRRDIIELVEDIAMDRPYMANRTLAVLSKFFNWLVARDIIEVSPAGGIDPPGQETARDRILSDDELRRLWLAACARDEGPFGVLVRLLILARPRARRGWRVRR